MVSLILGFRVLGCRVWSCSNFSGMVFVWNGLPYSQIAVMILVKVGLYIPKP